MSRTGGPIPALAIGIAVAGIAVACAHWPLSIWACTLAAFGAPHALVELRWVGRRYGRWRAIVPPVAAALALVAISRLLAFQLGWRTATLATIEVALGMLIGAFALPRELRRCVLRTGVAALVLMALGCGVALAPVDTLLVLAVLHNLTPVGLLADRLRDPDLARTGRARWLVAVLTGFVVLPLWLASGVAADWFGLAAANSTVPDLAAATTLDLALTDGLAAFVPSWFPAMRAVDLLRASAFLQCMHYVAVLLVLPRLGPRGDAQPPLPKRPNLPFLVLVTGIGVLFLAAFGSDFRESKAAYGMLAAVHVWAELPALLLALTPRPLVPRAA